MKKFIIAAAATLLALATFSASANKDGYYGHCHDAGAHQNNEGKFLYCINEASLACRVDCNRDYPDSADYRACAVACIETSNAHRNQQSWQQ